MTNPRSTLLGVGLAALVLTSCGQAADDADASLQPPQPVRMVASPAASAAASPASAGALAESDAALSMPAFIGFTYEISPDLPALPTASTGQHYRPGATVDVARVTELAAALGVDGEPRPGGGSEIDGIAWRVGPNDGSAPSLTISSDALLSVNYTAAWSTTSSVRCTEPVEIAIEGSDAATPDQEAVDSDEMVAPPPGDVRCEEPAPPVNVPTADDAEALAANLLGDLGQDPDAVEFETFADEWSASVTAWMRFDGVRSPMAWGFGFGENATLVWMNGSLASPVATGPYPLIGLDEAVQRLEEQSTWFGGGEVLLTDIAPIESADSSVVGGEVADDAAPGSPDTVPVETVPVETVPVETVPVETVPVETVPVEVATLVDVRGDLWWVWDENGSVWLLPAYTFTDTEGRVFTVPAVTDEFLIVVEPVLVDPLPLDPLPVEPEPGGLPEPDLGWIVGLSTEEATDLLAADGWTLRVVIDDGETLAVTEDFNTSRVNVEVADGIVVSVVSIG